MQRREAIWLSLIIFFGLSVSVGMGMLNGNFSLTSFKDYHDDSEIYNRIAFSILDRGSFHEEDKLFVGAFRRAPGYPVFLAMAYTLARTPITVWILQTILLACSIYILWLFSKFFFDYPYRLYPPALLACSWFIGLQATKLIPELFTLFLVLSLAYTIEKYFTEKKLLYLYIAGGSLAWILLIKPMAIYFSPFIVCVLLYRIWKYTNSPAPAIARALISFLIIPLLIVGAWTIRSYNLFHTFQIQSGSYVIAWKSLEATMPWERVTASFIGGLVGDVVADAYLPGYAQKPEPYEHVKKIFDRMLEMDMQGIPEIEKEQILYSDARNNIIANPAKFFVAGITGLLRQNTPINHKGQAITHLFAEGYENISPFIKLSIVICIRLGWYIFLGLVLYGMYLSFTNWERWAIVLIWIVFYNGLYAFFTHNEARYMIPVWPIYLLLFTFAISHLLHKHARQKLYE